MIGILTMADMQRRDGSSIRPDLEAQGLLKNGFRDFKVFSPNPRKDAPYKQEKVSVKKMRGRVLPFVRKRLGVDIVHAHQLSAMILKQRFITDMHGFGIKEKEQIRYNPVKGFFLPRIAKRIEIRTIKDAEKLIVASNSIKEDILEYFNDLNLDITVVNNMIKPEDYKKTKQKELVVGIVGGFTNDWGVENLKMLYEMLKIGCDFPIKTVGDITDGQMRMFEEFPNLKHLGRVSNKEYMEFLRSISVLLLPFPPQCGGGGSKNKLLEAAASSIPIVSTPAGAIGFDEKDLILIGKTAKSLIKRIKELENKSRRSQMGRKLRETIEKNYNYKTEAKKLIKIYSALDY